jgi:hypothetical protein
MIKIARSSNNLADQEMVTLMLYALKTWGK